MRIGAQTRLTGLVGGVSQVARSLSPQIHNAAFRALEMDWAYLPFPVHPGKVATAMDGLAAAGVVGLNVTMPHKREAAEAVGRLHPSAEAAGAVNAVLLGESGTVGFNTDGDGLVRFLELDTGTFVEDARVLVLGAGGSARAAVSALARRGPKSIVVAARSVNKAEELASLASGREFRSVTLERSDLAALGSHEILVNATPVGQEGEELPVPEDLLGPETVVVDLVYAPRPTPLVEAARRAGARAYSGLGILLHQAALSFEIWTGRQAPLETMSAAALAGGVSAP